MINSFLTKVIPYLKNHNSIGMGRILSFKVVAVSIRTYEEKDRFLKAFKTADTAVLSKIGPLEFVEKSRLSEGACSNTSKQKYYHYIWPYWESMRSHNSQAALDCFSYLSTACVHAAGSLNTDYKRSTSLHLYRL